MAETSPRFRFSRSLVVLIVVGIVDDLASETPIGQTASTLSLTSTSVAPAQKPAKPVPKK